MYNPPYSITEEMLELVMEIGERLGEIAGISHLDKMPRLRKAGRIRSVHSSLVIENNSLSFSEVSAILGGKRVFAPPDEVKAAENAFIAYKEAESADPFELRDFLRIHGLMMQGLAPESGRLRSGGEGVFGEGGRVVHIAPPANMLPALMHDLFAWLKSSKTHSLIKSCVFHYELEFIHPFQDGNGRMGRLWQTQILAQWKPIFAWIPVETIILKTQQEYYNAIARSTSDGSCNAFIMYMLSAISSAVDNVARDARNHAAHVSIYVQRLMQAMTDAPMTATEIMERLGLKSRDSFRKNYLNPAIQAGLIEMEQPKPTSKNQRYYKA